MDSGWPLDRRRSPPFSVLLGAIYGVWLFIEIIPTSAADVNGTTTKTHHTRRHGNSSVAIDHKHVQPARVPTYRNGYGTHFQCDSTCYFTTLAYLICIAALLGILAVIPVQSPAKPEEAPFLLWLGNNNDDPKHRRRRKRKGQQQPRQRGVIDRVSIWLYGEPEESSEEEEVEEQPQQQREPEVIEPPPPAKTYESVAVETDESLLPRVVVPAPPPDYVVVDDVDKLFDPLPKRKPGIFSPASPRLARRVSGMSSSSSLTSEPAAPPASPSKRAAAPSSPRRGSGGTPSRRATVVGAPVDPAAVLEAVEKRTSMQKRAEKRKEYAKSDIAHENLRDHELHTYEYLEFMREFLDGVSIKKVCQKSRKVVKRTFFITPDLSLIYWNSVGTKAWIVKKSSFDPVNIDKVIKGAQGNPNLQAKGKQEKNDLYVSVVMKDGKRLDLEAKDEAMRQRLYLGFTQLAADKKEEKRKKDAGEPIDPPAPTPSVVPPPAPPPTASRRGSVDQSAGVKEERRSKSEEDDPKKWTPAPETQEEGEAAANQEEEETGGGD